MKKYVYDFLVMTVGALFFALSVNLFVIPNELGEGGVTGITIITYYLYEWSPSVVSFILNGALLIIGYKFLSRQTAFYTLIAIILLSIFLHFTENWTIASDDRLLNTIFGGVFAGIGIGLIIRVGGTTAGSTILARISNKFLGWSISYSLLFFDLIVAIASYFVIGMEALLLTILLLYVATKVMEFVIEGVHTKKAVTIISNEHAAIAEQVNRIMLRGVTVLQGHGYYTKDKKDVLYIIINKQEVVKLKKIVRAIDSTAFVAIHDVRNVFGEGFIDLMKD